MLELVFGFSDVSEVETRQIKRYEEPKVVLNVSRSQNNGVNILLFGNYLPFFC